MLPQHRVAGILENGLDPAHSQLVSAITGEPVICYASLTRLGKDLVEIGQSINEHRLFVIVIRAANFKETHVFPDTTHQELADAQDAPDALSRSIDDYGRITYTRIVTAAEFADSFMIRNLYNLLLPREEVK